MKLSVQLIPIAAWGQNIRTSQPELWKILTWQAREQAGRKCQACGSTAKPLHVHEVWKFTPSRNSKGRQELSRLLVLCKRCHAVVHWGRSTATGEWDEDDLIAHACQVNGCNKAEWEAHVAAAMNRYVALLPVAEWELALLGKQERCAHGSALRDRKGNRLKPSCGCVGVAHPREVAND